MTHLGDKPFYSITAYPEKRKEKGREEALKLLSSSIFLNGKARVSKGSREKMEKIIKTTFPDGNKQGKKRGEEKGGGGGGTASNHCRTCISIMSHVHSWMLSFNTLH